MQGCVVVRTDYLEKNEKVVKEFLKEGDLVFLKASRSTKMELIEG